MHTANQGFRFQIKIAVAAFLEFFLFMYIFNDFFFFWFQNLMQIQLFSAKYVTLFTYSVAQKAKSPECITF